MARPTKDNNPTTRSQARQPEAARRGGRFQHAAQTARGAVDRIAGKHGFAEADVLLNWPTIAGEQLAAACQPVKVRYQNRSLGAVLVVQATSARAPEVEHMGPAIVEKVNQFYGYRAIHRLQVTQSTGMGGRRATRGFAEGQAAFAGPGTRTAALPPTPSPTDTARAEALTKGIRSPGLRAALTRMGANVLAESRRKDAGTTAPED